MDKRAPDTTGATKGKPKRIWPLTVRFSVFVCTLILLVGATSILALHGQRRHQNAMMAQAMLTGLSKPYLARYAESLASQDWPRIGRMTKVLEELPGIDTVDLFDPAGRLKAHSGSAPDSAGPMTTITTPIVSVDGAQLGQLRVSGQASAYALKADDTLFFALLGVGLLTLLSVPLTVLMVRRATAPLRELTAFAENISAQRLTMQINLKTGDEFETLAAAFNTMMGRLDSSMRRIQRLAFVDPATDLPNADRLQRELKSAVEGATRSGAPGALFILQLDKLNRASESLGQEAGAELLSASAQRLTAAVAAADPWANNPRPSAAQPFLARLSAHEFAVLFPVLPKGVELRAVANALIQPFDQSFEWREHRLSLGGLLGAAFFPRDGKDAEEVLRHARLALVAARETPLRMRFFTRSLDRAATAKLNLEKEMRQALEKNQFRAFFQPKINMRNNRIVGCEALARWVRPDRSVISPGKFIPAAEEMGLIGPISESIMRDACWKAAAWSREGLPARVAVNVSALQFADDAFPQKVLRILDQAGLPPQCLELEITESIAMHDIDRAVRLIRPLREQGVRFAIDDFGTGHSSLAALTRMPFEVLKIDQSFIRGLSQEGQAAAIVETILAMAAALNFDCVAEGVETEEEAEFLRRRGCPVAQGFLFSAAVQPTDFLKLLREGVIPPSRAGAQAPGASAPGAPAPGALDLAV